MHKHPALVIKQSFCIRKKPGFPSQLAKASRDVYENLEEELGIPFEFKKSGGMIVIQSDAHLQFMRDFVKNKTRLASISSYYRKEALENNHVSRRIL